jgi:hypothetical protein
LETFRSRDEPSTVAQARKEGRLRKITEVIGSKLVEST